MVTNAAWGVPRRRDHFPTQAGEFEFISVQDMPLVARIHRIGNGVPGRDRVDVTERPHRIGGVNVDRHRPTTPHRRHCTDVIHMPMRQQNRFQSSTATLDRGHDTIGVRTGIHEDDRLRGVRGDQIAVDLEWSDDEYFVVHATKLPELGRIVECSAGGEPAWMRGGAVVWAVVGIWWLVELTLCTALVAFGF